jgi:hypothetical protein
MFFAIMTTTDENLRYALPAKVICQFHTTPLEPLEPATDF